MGSSYRLGAVGLPLIHRRPAHVKPLAIWRQNHHKALKRVPCTQSLTLEEGYLNTPNFSLPGNILAHF